LSLPDQILLSELLSHSVRCDNGTDHGNGVVGWMHPPVHRLLGWVTRPSILKLSREVWSLNQIRGVNSNFIYAKGQPEKSNQVTIDRLPTLLDADLVNLDNIKIGIIADLVFEIKTGQILYYLVSRTDPRIPGTSRWRLSIDRILDQQPGLVVSSIHLLDDLPLIKSSLRQDFIRKSKDLRSQFQEISDKASTKLEGWLEEVPWEQEEEFKSYSQKTSSSNTEYNDWIDEEENEFQESRFSYRDSNQISSRLSDEDPWV
tara:strand:- start:2491 stop:3267 length:777 start_codon:yes stop_codon:yes gene_type:complete